MQQTADNSPEDQSKIAAIRRRYCSNSSDQASIRADLDGDGRNNISNLALLKQAQMSNVKMKLVMPEFWFREENICEPYQPPDADSFFNVNV